MRRSMRRPLASLRFVPLAFAPLLAPLLGCFSDAPVAPGPVAAQTATVEASAVANLFSPQTTTIAQGGTVTWTFGTRPHNVTFVQVAGVPTNVPTTTSNQASRTFTAAGTYAYACTLHAGMIGTVVVK
ncbi:MAG: hypothetical protein JO180_07110 [Gemmatirosa sp.]|nr:hypothetical protein [Gemmatirosa sp.]